MMVPVLLGVIIVIFTIMYMTPGDPARMILGEAAPASAVESLRDELGLNDSYFIQLVRYVKNVVLEFDFGRSYSSGKPVIDEILDRFPTTILLATLSVTISVVVGVTMGIISATKQYSIFDKIATSFSLIGVSMPTFWAGLMAVIIFIIIYVVSDMIIGAPAYDASLKSKQVLTAVVAAGCYWIGINKK